MHVHSHTRAYRYSYYLSHVDSNVFREFEMDWLQGLLVTCYDRVGHVKHDSTVRESIRWQCLDELYRWEYLRSTSSGWLNRQPMFCHNWITIQFCITIEEFHFLFEVRTLGLINQIIFITSRTAVGPIQLSSHVYLFLKLGLTSLFFATNLCHFLFMSIIYFWWNISRYSGTTWYPASVISVLPLKLWDVTHFSSPDISNPRYQRLTASVRIERIEFLASSLSARRASNWFINQSTGRNNGK